MIPRWLAWTLLAVLSWGIWAVLSKLIGGSLTPGQTQVISTVGILPVILALALSPEVRAGPNSFRGAALAFLAGALTCVGNVAYYHALNSGEKAATIVPLTALYPLVTALLAMFFLREKLNPIQLAGVTFALLATYLFNVPGERGLLNSALLSALVPILFWGLSGFVQKLSTNLVSGGLSAIWFLAAFVVAVGPFLAFQQGAALPAELGGRVLALAILLGLTFALGNFAILRAFASNGKASIIAPLAGLYPLVSIPIAILGLGERTSLRESLGIIIALASVAAISVESKPQSQPAQT